MSVSRINGVIRRAAYRSGLALVHPSDYLRAEYDSICVGLDFLHEHVLADNFDIGVAEETIEAIGGHLDAFVERLELTRRLGWDERGEEKQGGYR